MTKSRSALSQLGYNDLFAFNLRNRDRWIAAQAAQIPAGARVIDIGAGSAPYRPAFSHCQYKTQDFKSLAVSQLRDGEYAPIDYVCDAKAIPVAADSFEVALCSEVLEHHPEPIAVVQEISRILAPGGRLLLTAPLGSGIHQEPYHFYGGYTPYWYRKFLEAAGFEDIEVVANEGSFRHFGQESIRFCRMTRPFALRMPILAELMWLPFWCLLAPLLVFVIPIAAKLLDRFDREQRFTIGYHVRAVKRGSAGASA
jgi:SAM-dependent methyltransferase